MKLKDVYPLYLNNKAAQPNSDLVVTDKYSGEVAFRTALATPDVIDEAIAGARSEEHTSELQSLMRISYAVFCLKKKTKHNKINNEIINTKTHKYHTNRYTNRKTNVSTIQKQQK